MPSIVDSTRTWTQVARSNVENSAHVAASTPAREPPASSHVRGRVLVVFEHYGWIAPLPGFHHPKLQQQCHGCVYFKVSDTRPWARHRISQGSTVQFKVYCDSQGLGARDVRCDEPSLGQAPRLRPKPRRKPKAKQPDARLLLLKPSEVAEQLASGAAPPAPVPFVAGAHVRALFAAGAELPGRGSDASTCRDSEAGLTVARACSQALCPPPGLELPAWLAQASSLAPPPGLA